MDADKLRCKTCKGWTALPHLSGLWGTCSRTSIRVLDLDESGRRYIVRRSNRVDGRPPRNRPCVDVLYGCTLYAPRDEKQEQE